MIYDILEKKLTDAGIVEPGVSLFRNYMPPECMMGVMTKTPLAGIPIDPHVPGWYRVDMQLITRHRDPVRGYEMASTVAKLLKVETVEKYTASADRGAAHISLFYPKTLPIQFPRLEGNGYEFSQHFEAAFGFID